MLQLSCCIGLAVIGVFKLAHCCCRFYGGIVDLVFISIAAILLLGLCFQKYKDAKDRSHADAAHIRLADAHSSSSEM